MLVHVVLYSAEGLALLATLALLARVRLPAALLWAVAGWGLIAFVAATYLNYPGGQDLRIFWEAGRAVWRGDDPYADARVLNPPTNLPFYAAVALLPFPAMLFLWTTLNVIGYVGLVFLAQRAVLAQQADESWRLPAPAAAVLTAGVVLSFSSRYGIALGQLAGLTTVALLGALIAQGRDRPVGAGALLTAGAIKVGTMLPFLLLFLRKRDRLAWVSLIALNLGLALLANPPAELLDRCRECLANIKQLGRPGGMNDYAFTNPSAAEIIALDHAFYRLGLRDRTAIQLAQLITLLALGVWVAWQVWRPGMSRAAACCLVAFYATLFLYHRTYDMILLVLPLVYCAGRAMEEAGRRRWLFSFCVLAVLGVLYLRVGVLRTLTDVAAEMGGVGGWLVQAVILPYPVWLILGSMFCLAAAERSRQAHEDPAACGLAGTVFAKPQAAAISA